MAISKNCGSVAAAVTELALPLATEMGYILWDVEYVREGTDYILRITLDSEREGGITLDDCEAFSRAIDPLLDEADPVPDSYHLEISSPGIERILRTPAHIAACIGWKVEAHLFAPVADNRVHRGILQGQTEDGCILIQKEDGTLSIPAAAISRLTTVFDF